MNRRHIAWFCCLVVAAAGPACSGPITYGRNVGRDLLDVIDVRYGTGFGLGAMVEVSDQFQTGFGCSVEWYQRQWFGRKSVETEDGLFAQGLVIGFDGDYLNRLRPGQWRKLGNSTTGSFAVFFYNLNHSPESVGTPDEAWFTEAGGNTPGWSSGRIGGAVFLPGVHGGLYLNVGELLDLACGLVAYDLVKDDGYAKFSTPEPAVAVTR